MQRTASFEGHIIQELYSMGLPRSNATSPQGTFPVDWETPEQLLNKPRRHRIEDSTVRGVILVYSRRSLCSSRVKAGAGLELPESFSRAQRGSTPQ